jgi:hypothetical protein
MIDVGTQDFTTYLPILPPSPSQDRPGDPVALPRGFQ